MAVNCTGFAPALLGAGGIPRGAITNEPQATQSIVMTTLARACPLPT